MYSFAIYLYMCAIGIAAIFNKRARMLAIGHRKAFVMLKRQGEPGYGENLDALYDVLTGLPHRGTRFVLRMPLNDAPTEVRLYAGRIRRVFEDAGALVLESE